VETVSSALKVDRLLVFADLALT